MKKLLILACVFAFAVACGDEKSKNNPNTDAPSNSVDSVDDNHGVNDELNHHDKDDSVPATPEGERTPR